MANEIIGRSFPRIDAWEKVSGKARYAADIQLEGMLFMKVLRSTKPHAKILSINYDEAMKVHGVTRIFTWKDIPGAKYIGLIKKDQPVLAIDRVRYIGEPIALVVGKNLRSLESALKAIEVEYEELPLVTNVDEAIEGAILLHEDGNLLSERRIVKGNVEEGFGKADLIIEKTYVTSMVEHAYLEPDAGVAWIGEKGEIVICVATQNPHYDQAEVARVLGIEPNHVRVIQSHTGGGFGSKLDITVQCHLALAVYYLKSPVKLVYTREEVFLSTAKRHPFIIRYRSGVSKNGRLLAVDVDIVGDTGAYASYGPAVCTRAAIHATGPYEVPHVRIRSRFYYTNNQFCGAMRGFGVPQVAFAHESQMDVIAKELGIDPLEIRIRNALRPGSITSTGQILSSSVGLLECLNRLKPYWESPMSKKLPPSSFWGKGLAAMWYGIGNTGIKNPSRALVKINADGKIRVYTGAAEIGQGSDTVLWQIASATLGVRLTDIEIVRADTGLTLDAGATSASRQTYISGNAVAHACWNLRNILIEEAAFLLRMRKEEIVLSEGVFKNQRGEALISLKELARKAHAEGKTFISEGFFDPPTTPLDPETSQGSPYATYAFGCHMVELIVDGTTGFVDVKRVIAAHDVGRAINPRQVIGQIMGGISMGLGYALMEEFTPNRTLSFKDYIIPTSMDVPEIIPIIVEDPEPTGPFGAKGVGEPALIPTAPAVINAIVSATGKRIYALPASLERVLKITKDEGGRNG